MTREELFQWVKQEYGTEAEYPWKDSNAVLRRADNNKWYGVILSVAGSKLRGVDDNIVIASGNQRQLGFKHVFASRFVAFQLNAGQQNVGGKEVSVGCGANRLIDGKLFLEHFIHGVHVFDVHAKAETKIALWVEVNAKNFIPALGKRRDERGCCGCFSDAALLVGNGNDFRHRKHFLI